MSQLLPPGIEGLADCPFTLHDAVHHALYFLSFEELPLEDRPPRHIWLDSERMSEWWERRERARKEKFGDPDTDAPTGPTLHNSALEDMIDRG